MSDKMREALGRLRAEVEKVRRDENKYAECAYSVTADTLEWIADDIEAATAEQPAQGEAVKPGQYVIQHNDDGEFGQKTGWLYRDGGDPCVVTGKPVYVWRPLRDLIGAPPAPAVPMAPPVAFAEWLRSNMPPDTVISDPDWWAMAIWSAARRAINAAPVASGGKASVQWETCESQCTCKVCGTVWTAPEPPR